MTGGFEPCPRPNKDHADPLLGETYQAYEVRTSCVTQEMGGEALKGDRRSSPCGYDNKLRRDRGEKYMRPWKVNEVAEVERLALPCFEQLVET